MGEDQKQRDSMNDLEKKLKEENKLATLYDL